MLEERELYELRQLCVAAALSQESLGALIDAQLSVPVLVRSEAAAMAAAKRAGLPLADRQKLREGLRRHRDEVLSAEQPSIVEIGDDAEAYHIVAAQQHMAEARARARMQHAEEAKGVEVVKNGNICAGYRWTQELSELVVSIELPPGTSKRDVVCKFTTQTITAGLRDCPPIIEGALFAKVKVDECLWQLQDSHRLIVTLQKLVISSDEYRWWPCLVQGEPEIDTSTCETGASTNLMVSQGQRIALQKIELPDDKDAQRREYSPEMAEKAWRDFFKKFPEMHAWEITLDANSEQTMEEQLVAKVEKAFAKETGTWEHGTS